jgi:hypothetical protein
MSSIAEIAADWRATENRAGGVVVVFGNEVTGWMDELRDPHHFVPGCIAINDNNQQWKAVGGNSYDGATEWQAAS